MPRQFCRTLYQCLEKLVIYLPVGSILSPNILIPLLRIMWLITPDDTQSLSKWKHFYSEDAISFSEVDIITPAQKLLARQLTCDIVPGESLLVTGLLLLFDFYYLYAS